MKRLILALSLASLVGVLILPWSAAHAYTFENSGDQARWTAPGSYRAVAWHRYYWQDDDRDFDRPYVRHYYYDYYDPYYYPYPYTYYYGPGFSVNTPFFGINIP